ncbi:MAG: ATP-dependent DNA ligase [Methanoregulaceae archaeon PtaB.Bin009]|nr:MAG: ATP-dependent DNA ligase [Methanoregulaceae archaeon PtaB.Bin009]
MTILNADGHEIMVSNTRKVFFPDAGITKGDLINYYQKIAATMLPHMKGRPVSMERFPDGIGEEGFYQKEVPDYFPPWIRRIRVDLVEGGAQDQVVCDSAATLVFLADQGCITPHTWLSLEGNLGQPDQLLVDLDPPDADFEPVREAAFLVKEFLDDLGLRSCVMTTGSRGLHVIVPIRPDLSFDQVREHAKEMAGDLASRNQKLLTDEIRKEKRKGRVFLDVLRNAYGQTSVPPYAVRPRPGAPIATPVEWDELSHESLVSASYTIRNIFRRLGQKEDPWKDIFSHRQSLDSVAEKRKRVD